MMGAQTNACVMGAQNCVCVNDAHNYVCLMGAHNYVWVQVQWQLSIESKYKLFYNATSYHVWWHFVP